MLFNRAILAEPRHRYAADTHRGDAGIQWTGSLLCCARAATPLAFHAWQMAHCFLGGRFVADQLFSRQWVPDETACDSRRGRLVRGRDYILPPPGLSEGGSIPPLQNSVMPPTPGSRRRQASMITLSAWVFVALANAS